MRYKVDLEEAINRLSNKIKNKTGTEKEMLEDIKEWLEEILRKETRSLNERVICTSSKCKYNLQNKCTNKNIRLENGICKSMEEEE